MANDIESMKPQTIIGIAAVIGLAILFYSSYNATPQAPLASGTPQATGIAQGLFAPHKWMQIKYRSDAVDLDNPRFEYTNTSASSFVEGAWYDAANQYM